MSGRKNKHGAHGTNYTPLGEHKRSQQLLTPPLATLPMQHVTWFDRLPETLWAALLLSGLGREAALARFRRVLRRINELKREGAPPLVTHSGLAAANPDERRHVLESIAAGAAAQALRPLLLLASLPARDDWTTVLPPSPEDPTNDWMALKRAVALTLDHQSQEATDCRWLRVMDHMAQERLKFPPEMEDGVRELLNYPNEGDQRSVRPRIRSTEISLSSFDSSSSSWPLDFWNACRTLSPCDLPQFAAQHAPVAIATTLERFRAVRTAVLEHMDATRSTTGVDARHDGSFGLTLYCLAILEELLRVGAATSILSRAALRTLVECAITLAYLAKKDTTELWQTYRVYGAGQAKLALLKFLDQEKPPTFVDRASLESLASEDLYLEFVSIDLGHWDKLDTRRMSEHAGVKELYDRYYQWPSGFVHGQWAAVRDASMQTCWNPLHRLHRVGRSVTRAQNDVLHDACAVTDHVLATLGSLYPAFSPRLLQTDAVVNSESGGNASGA